MFLPGISVHTSVRLQRYVIDLSSKSSLCAHRLLTLMDIDLACNKPACHLLHPLNHRSLSASTGTRSMPQ